MTQESFSFPSEFEVSTRHLVMERHLNPYGNVFGGTVLAWLDEGAALFLMEKIGYTNFVTVSMNHVDFKAPGHRGDAVQILCRVLRTGRSSVTVQAKAVSHEAASRSVREIITCEITYVCLKDDRPYPYFQSEEYRAWRSRPETLVESEEPLDQTPLVPKPEGNLPNPDLGGAAPTPGQDTTSDAHLTG